MVVATMSWSSRFGKAAKRHGADQQGAKRCGCKKMFHLSSQYGRFIRPFHVLIHAPGSSAGGA
ncbi:hypothetical protein AGRO_4313 [Agrobacterium sp. ATCC 31749]|nr:hypothetical protein AGRO_4313 [Agrobacterium sp. ATCC 31749]